ncbi:MAG TPA: multiheme c-type cytochrome [bacterium]|nr:multiheme c-type cytochrome [bacterium]
MRRSIGKAVAGVAWALLGAALLALPTPSALASPGLPPLPQSLAGQPTLQREACTGCHKEAAHFSRFHDPALIGCASCHGGNGAATDKAAAHAGMEAWPGRAATAQRSCGQAGCHQEQVTALRHSIMNTANGMIELTREVLGAPPAAGRGLLPAQRLAETGVDSYLRKLCVSCHLSNERRERGQSLLDRGGGCNACHLQTHAAPEAMGEAAPEPDVRTGNHPTLTATIPDERCFGCHSRSSRISLNYVGLGEVDAPNPAWPGAYGHLPDGRLVEKLKPDLHSVAGLSCTDCHTAPGVMGTGQAVTRLAQQLDVQCEDCHASRLREKPVAKLTRRELLEPGLRGWTNPDLLRGSLVVTERRGTPLWNVFRKDGRRFLREKVSGKEVSIPVMRMGRNHTLKAHERLTCSACHDTWAPQCDGCHISYDANARQWDHLRREETPGKWIERRWHVHNDAPALGITARGRIAPFVPGMNLIAELPGRKRPLRTTRFTRMIPHTTQRAGRTCASCHRSEQALGVITGMAPAPGDPAVQVPIGWVRRNAKQPGQGLRAGERSLNRAERRRVSRVGDCLACHADKSRIYDDFAGSLAAIAAQRPHPAPGTHALPP